MKAVTCKEAQSLIPKYIANKLTAKELEQFILHVRECQECYDELETFFMIDRAVRYLDEETEQFFNLKSLFEKDLKEKNHMLAKGKRRRRAGRVLSAAAVLLMALALLDLFGIVQISRLL